MINLEIAKQYLRIDGDDENNLIQMCLDCAKSYVKDYTGLSDDEIAENKTLDMATLALIADMYELRQATISGLQQNPFVEYVLNMYQRNLL